MAFEDLEALPRGKETPNVYGPADQPLAIQVSQLMGSVRKNDKVIVKRNYKRVPSEFDYLNKLFLVATPDRVIVGDGTLNKVTTGISKEGLYFNSPTLYSKAFPRVGSTEVTVLYAVYCPVISNSDVGTAIEYAGGSAGAGQLAYSNGRRLACSQYFYPDYTGSTGLSTDDILVPGTISLAVFRYIKDKEFTAWVNGVKVAEGSVPTSAVGIRNNKGGNISIGNSATDNSIQTLLAGIGDFALTDAQIIHLSKNYRKLLNNVNYAPAYIPQTPILPSKVGLPGIQIGPQEYYTSQPQEKCGCRSDVLSALIPILSGTGYALPFRARGVGHYNDSLHSLANSPYGTFSTVNITYEDIRASKLEFDYLNTRSPMTAVSAFVYTGASMGVFTDSHGIEISVNATGNIVILVGSSLSTTATITPGYHNIAVDIYSLNGSADRDLTIYVDGKRVAYFPAVYLYGMKTTQASPRAYGSPVPSLAAGYVLMAALVSGCKGRELSTNPWQLFTKPRYKVFVGNNTLPNVQTYRNRLIPTQQRQISQQNNLERFVWLPCDNTPIIGNAGTKAEQYGMALYTDGGTASSGVLPKPRFAAVEQIWVSVVSMTEGNNMIGCGLVDNNSPYIEDLAYNTPDESANVPGTCMLFLRDNSSGLYIVGYTPPYGALNNGKPHVIVWRLSSSSTMECFIDGILQSVSYWSYTGYSPIPSNNGGVTEYNPWLHNRNLRGVGQLGSSSTLRTYLYARLKGSSEYARSLSKNPWQLIEAPRVRIPNKTYVKPQPLLLPQKQFVVMPRYPTDVKLAKENCTAAICISNNLAWDGLTGKQLIPTTVGEFTGDLYGVSNDAYNPEVFRVPNKLRPHLPFTIVLVWSHNNGMAGEYSRVLFQITPNNGTDALGLSGPDWSSYLRYDLFCIANYTGYTGPIGAPDRLLPNKTIVTVIRSTGKGGVLNIFDNIASSVLTASAPTSDPYSSTAQELLVYSFKNSTFKVGTLVAWDVALPAETCRALAANPAIAFNDNNHPARLK